MIDLWAVVVLIVGIILTFAGTLMAVVSASLRKPVEALHLRVDRHDIRIGDLERMLAVQDAEVKRILSGIEELKNMLNTHFDRHHHTQ